VGPTSCSGAGGGGGGGRIALYYDSNVFAGTISVAGGPGHQYGEPGTIFLAGLIEVDAALDWDWVYQNAPQTTQGRHHATLTITLGADPYANSTYTIEVLAEPADAAVIEPTADPLVWTIKGGQAGVGPYGTVTVDVLAMGVEAGGEGGTRFDLSICQPGDIDGSGAVTAEDKQYFNQRLNGVPTPYPDRCYDLTGNGGAPNAEDKQVMNQVLNGVPLP